MPKYLKTGTFYIFFLAFLVFLSFQCQVCLAQVGDDTADRFPTAIEPFREEAEEVRDYYAFLKDRLAFSFYIDVQQGFDTNVDLDSKKHSDGFIQSVGNAEVGYKVLDTVTLKGGLDIFETIYYTYNDNNIFDTAPYVAVDWQVYPGFTWKNKVLYDYYWYPNDRRSTYSGAEYHTYLRHFVTETIYHEPGYEYIHRWYPDRKVSKNDGSIDNADREDSRHKMKWTVGVYFPNSLIKVSNEFYHNDSNDMFQDYYDYWVYRLRPSAMYFLTDSLYVSASFVYKLISYDDRRSTQNQAAIVHDDTYIATGSVFYDVTKNFTLSFTYSYSENQSNDPFQKYSDSIVSGGLSCAF